MEDVKLIYSSDNQEVILINHFNLKVLKNNNEIGYFNINENILNINFDNNISYYFTKIDDNNDISTYKFINNYSNEIEKNNIEININNNLIEFDRNIDYKIIDKDKNLILLKNNNYYNKIYKKTNNIYNDITQFYDKLIYIKNNSWEEHCVINDYTHFIYRSSNIDEYGNFEINNNILTISWEKWDKEIFYLDNDIYIKKNNLSELIVDVDVELSIKNVEENIDIDKCIFIEQIEQKEVFIEHIEQKEVLVEQIEQINQKEVYFNHKDWNEYCIIDYDKNILYKKYNINEIADVIIEDNKIILNWKKWNSETFYLFDEQYYLNQFIKYVEILSERSVDKENKYVYILNQKNNRAYICSTQSSGINNYTYINEYILEENYIIIDEKYYYKEIDNKLIAYKNEYEESIIYKNNIEIKVLINILNDTIKTNDNKRDGTYDKYDDILKIYWDNIIFEEYVCYNFKYYDSFIYKLNNKNIYVLNNNGKYILKINIVDNLLYNDYYKIKYIQNNNIFVLFEDNELKTYYMEQINEDIILVQDILLEGIYDKLKSINYNIYRHFNQDISNLTDIELYQYFIQNAKKENRIYSIDNFLEKINLDYNYLNNYIDLNNIEIANYENAVIYWKNNNSINKKFISNKSIETVYVSFNLLYNKSLYIINLNDNSYLENIVDTISKTSNIIININFTNENKIDNNLLIYIDSLKEYFNNIILIKSKDISNYELMLYIYKYIILNNIDDSILYKLNINISSFKNIKDIENEINKINLLKIIYINKNINYIEDVIINFQNMNEFDYSKKSILYIDDSEKILIENKNNLILYQLLNYCHSLIDIIYMIIYYYIINIKIYDIFNNNIIFNYEIMEIIFNKKIYEELVLIKK